MSDDIAAAKKFLLDKWRERASGLGRQAPDDLSGACKFVSQFARNIFGGKIEAHFDHCWVRLEDGSVLDLTDGVDSTTYVPDRAFMRRREFRDSLRSCRERVRQWVDEFRGMNETR